MVKYAALAAVLGCLNGWLSRHSLKRVMDKPDKIFFAVWAAGVLYRLFFTAGAIVLLYFRKENSIIIVVFAAVLIFFQFIFGLLPVKNGDKGAS